MKRIPSKVRNHWQAEVEKLGFGFHSTEIPYWDESVYYQFDQAEIAQIENATHEVWKLCLEAVQQVIDQKKYSLFSIPEQFIPLIENSWNNDHPSIYGRFDFCFKNGAIKLLEFNADTPTSLFEAGIVQWYWLKDFDRDKDQFNSIHEKLIDYWKYLRPYLHPGKLHFSCVKESLEDLTTTEYLRDCAIQAGIETKLVFIDDIGWQENLNQFVDLENEPIQNLFKLYPWEWMTEENFGKNIICESQQIKWIEPAWKMILSNKAILPILWELFPNSPYLLPAYFEPGKLTDYVKKPILSREGANIELVKNQLAIEKTDGEYANQPHIYQALFTLPNFADQYPVIGSWLIGQEAAGIGIRESSQLVTDNQSRFVPHLIID